MKRNYLVMILSLLTAVLSLPACGQQLGGSSVRIDQWEFSLDSAHWQQVTVPHSYNAIDGHSKKYYRGKGFYRLTLAPGKHAIRVTGDGAEDSVEKTGL